MAKPIPFKFTSTYYLKENDEAGILRELSRVYETANGVPLALCKKEQLFRIHERIYRKQVGLPPIKPKSRTKKIKVEAPWYQG